MANFVRWSRGSAWPVWRWQTACFKADRIGASRVVGWAALRPSPPRLDAALRTLERPRAHFVIAALALALLSPSLWGGLVLDDHVLALKARPNTGIAGLASEPLRLFTFTTGQPARNHALMDEGVLLPWWTDPLHRNAFFRPLSSLTHLLDFTLWPDRPFLMHLQSLLWFGALLAVLSLLYRRLSQGPLWLATLALLLYAFDDVHGATVGWIANRNAVIAAALALPALLFHHRLRSQGLRAGALLGPLCFALGLGAGETAISVFGYLLAYALCLDRGSLRTRLFSLWPYAALLLLHRGIYHALGLGSFGSSAYHDPLQEPGGFLLSLAYNLPVLLSAQLGARTADLASWGDPLLRAPLYALAWLTLLPLLWLALPRLRQDAEARFWALGMLLSAIPVSASLPGERLLLLISVGAAPLLAHLIAAPHLPGAVPASLLRTLLIAGLALVHLVASPITLPLRAASMNLLGAAVERVDASVPSAPAVRDQTLVVVNAPVNVTLSYLQVAREQRGQARPAHVYWLASASSELTVERSAPRSLRVSLARGYLYRPEETHYRSRPRGLGIGSEVVLSGLRAKVVASLPDGRPKSVEFSFEQPFESSRYLLRKYQDGVLVPWQPPALGASDHFPAEDLFRVVVSEALR